MHAEDTELTLVGFGASQWPLIRHGDLLRYRAVTTEAICVGDLLICRRGRIRICHRVLAKRRTSRGVEFLTRGDRNLTCDGWTPMHRVDGRVFAIGDRYLDNWRWALLSRLYFIFSRVRVLAHRLGCWELAWVKTPLPPL